MTHRKKSNKTLVKRWKEPKLHDELAISTRTNWIPNSSDEIRGDKHKQRGQNVTPLDLFCATQRSPDSTTLFDPAMIHLDIPAKILE